MKKHDNIFQNGQHYIININIFVPHRKQKQASEEWMQASSGRARA